MRDVPRLVNLLYFSLRLRTFYCSSDSLTYVWLTDQMFGAMTPELGQYLYGLS